MTHPRLSINQATVKHAPLPDAIEVTRAAGVSSIGLWREPVAEVGLQQAAALLADSGLRFSSLCRGGFFTTADPAERARALDANRRGIEETAALAAAGAPGSAAVLVLVAGGALGLHRVGGAAALPDAPPPRAFHLSHGLLLALVLAAVLLFSAWMRAWLGEGGALLAASLVALGELHAAGAGLAQLATSGALDPLHVEWGVLALLAAAALSKSVLAFASGGAGYGARVAVGLFASLLAAVAVQALRVQ